MSNNLKTIYLAGGCFWGLQDLLRKQKGIVETKVGYTGGENENPTYKNHPKHAEAIKVIYDENETNYVNILDCFFRIHNPTTINQQGNDIGDSYRSAIFYQNENEKLQAEEFIKKVNISGRWENEVVTKLEEFKAFYLAEPYHQDYLRKNPGGYTCHFERFEDKY